MYFGGPCSFFGSLTWKEKMKSRNSQIFARENYGIYSNLGKYDIIQDKERRKYHVETEKNDTSEHDDLFMSVDRSADRNLGSDTE